MEYKQTKQAYKKPQQEKKAIQKPENKAIKIDPEQEKKDVQDYNKFVWLYGQMWNGDEYSRKALKPKILEEFDKLENKFKNYKGHIPTKSKNVYIGTGQTQRIIKGYAVPQTIYKIFVEAGIVNSYFHS
jgi:hypothetical protein